MQSWKKKKFAILHRLLMLCYLKQPLQVAAGPVWSRSVWILHPALRQAPTAPPQALRRMLFSAFTQTAYCACPHHTHTQTHKTLLLCVRVSHAAQDDGPLLGRMLTDSHLTRVSGIFWMTLYIFQTLTAVSRNEKWSDGEGGECGIVNTFFPLRQQKDTKSWRPGKRTTDKQTERGLSSNHIKDYLFICLARFL